MTIQTSSDLDDLGDLVRHYASLGNSQDFHCMGCVHFQNKVCY